MFIKMNANQISLGMCSHVTAFEPNLLEMN